MAKWREKLPGLGRKLLILALLVSAALLLRETGYLSGISRRFRPGENTDITDASSLADPRSAGMVQPLAAVVCGADGGRYGAAYDRETVMGVFQRFSVDIVEALGSAGTPEAITPEEFQDCLSRNGVLLRFYGSQPLALLSVCLGGEMRGEAEAYRAELLCLCADGEGVALCFRTEDGDYYRCTTAVPQEGLQARTGEYTPNGASYAFELPLLSGSDGCAVILEGAVQSAVVQCGIPLPSGDETDALLEAVGMNSYGARSYTEADGTVVFVGDGMTLRLAPTGAVSFRRTGAANNVGSYSLTGAVTAAWALAEQSIGKSCGDAVLFLADVQESEGQRVCTVSLDYAVNGVPVRQASGPAAQIVFRDGVPVQATLAFRRYTLTEKRETLLPGLQAAAMAAKADATAELIYPDGGESMHCIWVKSDG